MGALADLGANLVLDLLQDLRTQFDRAWLVDAVHVFEGQRGDVAALLPRAEDVDRTKAVFNRGVELLVDLGADPSSSPPTTPTSISKITLAADVSASSSSAMARFSSTGTADPSHMWDWKIGRPPFFTRSVDRASSGRTKPSSLFFGQWSVCSPMLIE